MYKMATFFICGYTIYIYYMSITHKNEYGCLMAMVNPTYGPHIIRMNKTAIPSGILYIDPEDPTYGYDEEPHVTIKYGFSPDLTRMDLANVLRNVRPFKIKLTGIGQFQNEKYDVVKFNVDRSDDLTRLREMCDGYKNEDKYPDYKPHMTLAYVKKGTFPQVDRKLNIELPITRFKYSGMNGKNLYINL